MMAARKLPTSTGDELKWAVAKTGDAAMPRFTVETSNLSAVEAHALLTVINRLQLYRAARVDATVMEGQGENLAQHPEVLRVLGEYLNRESGHLVVDPAKRA